MNEQIRKTAFHFHHLCYFKLTFTQINNDEACKKLIMLSEADYHRKFGAAAPGPPLLGGPKTSKKENLQSQKMKH